MLARWVFVMALFFLGMYVFWDNILDWWYYYVPNNDFLLMLVYLI